MDEFISYKMCAVKVRNAKLRNYLKHINFRIPRILHIHNESKELYILYIAHYLCYALQTNFPISPLS
jgi:hypothetical protein